MNKDNFKKFIWIIVLILSLIVLDQVFKIFAINGICNFKYIENVHNQTGQVNIMATYISQIVIIVILARFLIFQNNNMDIKTKISISLILSGGISNLASKIIYGKTINYIDLTDIIEKFPTFNLADICIISGFILFAIFTFIYMVSNRKDLQKRGKEI